MAYNSTIDKATDDILVYGNTAKDGSGTSYVPLLDADGQLQVDVLSNALPTGASTLAEQQSQTTHLATIAGDTTAIQTAVEILDNAISGTEMQVDVIAALPAGTNAIGKLAANTGVDIGDVDVTSVVPGTGATNLGKAEDGGHTSGDVGVFNLGVRVDTPNTALTNTDADYSPITTNKLGSLRTAIPEDDLATAATNHVKKYYTNAGAVTDGIVWSPAAGKRWFVTDIFIGVSAASTVTLEDDLTAGDAAVFKMEFAANSGWSHTFATPWFSGEDAADLLVTTTAGNVYITITGYEI